MERAFGPVRDLNRIDIARTDRLLCRRPVCGIDARGRWTGLRLYRWWRLKLTGQRQRHRRLDDLDRLCRFGLLNGRAEVGGVIVDRGRRGFARAGSKRQRGGRYEQRSEEHTSELQSLMRISYAVFGLKQKNNK